MGWIQEIANRPDSPEELLLMEMFHGLSVFLYWARGARGSARFRNGTSCIFLTLALDAPSAS